MTKTEEIKKKAEKYVRANSVYYGNDDYRLNMKDWLYFVEGLYNEVTSQTKQELIEEVKNTIKSKIHYWHIRFEGVNDEKEKSERIKFNEEVSLLINGVLENLLEKLSNKEDNK